MLTVTQSLPHSATEFGFHVRQAFNPYSRAEFVHCLPCGGWVNARVRESILANRDRHGTAYRCPRCSKELTFVGVHKWEKNDGVTAAKSRLRVPV